MPDGGAIIDVSEPSCTQYPLLTNILMLPLCKRPQIQVGSVCAFFYGDVAENSDSCSCRKYGIITYKSYSEAINNNAVIAHEEGM